MSRAVRTRAVVDSMLQQCQDNCNFSTVDTLFSPVASWLLVNGGLRVSYQNEIFDFILLTFIMAVRQANVQGWHIGIGRYCDSVRELDSRS